MGNIRVLALVVCVGSVCWAQVGERRDSWLMQNYRFVTPPAPDEAEVATPAVAQLQEIQNTVLSIMRKANFEGDYQAALAAAAQAAANAQLMGRMAGQVKPVQPSRAPQPIRPGARSFDIARSLKAEPQR